MVRKDEPLKVTDLESGEDPSASNSKSKDAPPKSKSVFNRLAYGSGSRSSKKADEKQQPEANKTSQQPAGKADRLAVKTVAKTNASKTGDGTQATPSSSGGGSGSGSVFDRLTSGDRLYRSTTQTGRKPAGRRAEPSGDFYQSGKPTSTGGKLPTGLVAIDEQAPGSAPQTTADPVNDSLERDEMDASVEGEEEDSVYQISLIQPPAKIRSPRLKKSARLIVPQDQDMAKKRRRKSSWRLQRIPLAFVERTSLARGALPILPPCLAWICLIFNGFLPGTGTILSGLFGICLGAPRFAVIVTGEHRFLGFVINLTVGLFQAVTVLFCLVGWCWSLGWGIILVKTAGHYESWKKNNQDNPEEELPHVMSSMALSNAIKDEPIRY